MLEGSLNGFGQWLLESANNLNTYIAIIMLLLIIGFVLSAIFYKKLGKSDERSDNIKLRINQWTLGVGFVSAMAFISALDKDTVSISQLGLLPLTATVLAGAITSVIYYVRNS